MFEKLSQAMRGNQNARKNPIKAGVLAGLSTAGVATLINTTRRVANDSAAFDALKMAKKYKGRPAAKKMSERAIGMLKSTASEGFKAGVKKSLPLSAGVALGTGVTVHLMK